MVEKSSDHSSDKSPSTPEQAVQRTYSQSLHTTRPGGKNSKVNVDDCTCCTSQFSYTACLAHLLLPWDQIPHQCRLLNSILSQIIKLQVIYTCRDDSLHFPTRCQCLQFSFPVNLLINLVSCLSR